MNDCFLNLRTPHSLVARNVTVLLTFRRGAIQPTTKHVSCALKRKQKTARARVSLGQLHNAWRGATPDDPMQPLASSSRVQHLPGLLATYRILSGTRFYGRSPFFTKKTRTCCNNTLPGRCSVCVSSRSTGVSALSD